MPARRAGYVVQVLDGDGASVFRDGRAEAVGLEVRGRMSFVFSDWEIVLGRVGAPGAWARWDFLLDVALSAVLAAILLAGLAFTLRAASRELKLSRMKSDFLSNVSHELRTPLASIRVFGEHLRVGRVGGDRVREYGAYIENESGRLTQLVDNILDFSRIESGAKTYVFELADLGSIVEQTLRPLAVSLAHAGFTLRYEPPAATLPLVRVDREAVAQALANLVDNAVKYSGSSREVAVQVDRVDGEARVTVRDRGVGIAADEHERIFERFHRVSTGLVHDVKGSGLGLAIVRHVAEAHGGRVSVSSALGRGSVFTLHVPLAEGGCAAS
jgi:signal transduction histidine kinase